MMSKKIMLCAYSRLLAITIVSGIWSSGVPTYHLTALAASSQQSQRSPSLGKPKSDDAVEVLPDKVLQHVTRGGELVRLEQYDQAIEEFRAAIKTAGRPVFTAYLNIGSAFFSKGDYPQAVDSFKFAVTIRPNSYKAHYNLAESLYAVGDFAGAEKEYRRVLELSSGLTASRARHFLGLTLYKEGRRDEAITEYREAISEAGKYAEAHYNLGIALLELKKPETAETEFRLAIEEEKTPWPEAQYNLAKAIENQGRFREAADAYEVYLKLAPAAMDSKTTREYIDYLRRKK